MKTTIWWIVLMMAISSTVSNFSTGHYFIAFLGALFCGTLILVKPNGGK